MSRTASPAGTTVMRALALGVLAGLAGGIVAGIGARIAMRIVALAIARDPEFTIGGTLVIGFVGMFFGLMAGVVYAAVRALPRLPRPVRALLLAAILIGGVMVPAAVAQPDELNLAPGLGFGLFAAVAIAYAFAVEWMSGPIARRLDRDDSGAGALVALGVFGGLIGLLLLASTIAPLYPPFLARLIG